jgi:hypothetical protein
MISKAFLIPPALLAAAIGLAACGGSSGPQTYLAHGASDVVLVQWQPGSSGSGIQGTITADTISGTPPSESVSVNSAPFTGTINGSAVTLDINGGFLVGTKTLNATLDGSTLTIGTLSSGGTIQESSLQQSDTSAYNQDVAALHKSVSQANTQALAAQQAQAQQQANTQAEQTAQNDLSTLGGADSFRRDLNALSSDVSQTNSDLAAEKTAAAKGPNADGGGCYNLEENVDYDATENVDYDATDDLGYDLQENLKPDISTVRSDIATLKTDLVTLNAAALPAPAGAAAAITAAHQAIQQAIASANADIDQVNADVSEAYSIGNGMATSSCTGPGATPAPIGHI